METVDSGAVSGLFMSMYNKLGDTLIRAVCFRLWTEVDDLVLLLTISQGKREKLTKPQSDMDYVIS